MRIRRRHLLGAMPLLALPRLAGAQSAFPSRGVTIVVPFPPGGGTDVLARILAQHFQEAWRQTVVVENRGGGAGAPALEAGARAAPDGYTLTAGTSGTLGVNPSVLPNIPYDAGRDFAFITNVAMVPLLIVAHPSFAANTPQELIAMAKARPGGIDMASAGPATSQHLAAELLAHRTGVKFNIVHYRGSGPAIADLVAGTVPVMFDSVASARGNIAGGRVKPIGIATARRIPQLPNVPTFAETVSPGYEAAGWTGLVAPAATPAEIVRKVNADVVAVLRDPAVVKRLEEMAVLPDPGTPEEFGAFVRAEIVKWREVVRLANVRLEG
jgi:tripartite-type tricarboxylate transporter receptor subunit TctC